DTSTTINGFSSQRFTGVKNISIDLGDGDDHITMGNGNVSQFVVPGDLSIYKGSGNESITLNRITVSGSMDIFTDGSRADGTRTMITPGNNTIDIAGNFNVNNFYSWIQLGNGNDSLVVHDATFGSELFIMSGQIDPITYSASTTGDKIIDLYSVTVRD